MNDLEAVSRPEHLLPTRTRAHACIITEYIQRSTSIQPPLSKSLNTSNTPTVELPPLDRRSLMSRRSRLDQAFYHHVLGMRLSRRWVSTGKDEVGAPFGELQRRFSSYAIVAPRYDDPFAGEIGRRYRQEFALATFPGLRFYPGWVGLFEGERCIVGDGVDVHGLRHAEIRDTCIYSTLLAAYRRHSMRSMLI